MNVVRSITVTTAALVALAAAAGTGASGRPDARNAAARQTLLKHVATDAIGLPTQAADAQAFGDGLATDADGNLYAVYYRIVQGVGFWDVAVFAPNGTFLRRFDLRLGGLGSPHLAVGGPDNLVYVTLADSRVMYAYTRDGTLVRELGKGELLGVRDVEVDSAGNVYALSRLHSDEEIVRLDRQGAVTARFAPLPAAKYGSPSGGLMQGLAVAPDGSIWVTAAVADRQLIHLDASGRDLGDAPHLDVLIPDGGLGFTHDVDFANGLLYVSGRGHTDQGVAVLSSQGALVDVLCCTDRDVALAVTGRTVYATGFTSAPRLTAASARSAEAESRIKKFTGFDVPYPRKGDSTATVEGDDCSGTADNNAYLVPFMKLSHLGHGCTVTLTNNTNPCSSGTIPTEAKNIWVGGNPSDAAKATTYDDPIYRYRGSKVPFSKVEIPSSALADGSVVVEWLCSNPATRKTATALEWKGQFELKDPSGTVVDATTARPVEAASVRLEFSPVQTGPFRVPGLSGFSPQLNPQVTAADGHFGWDVAEGFWRLRVKAFGYRPLTSAVFHVPPEVTGLQLKLRQNPTEQRFLIDPRGRVGSVQLGGRRAKRGRVPGLRIDVVAGKVRRIVVRGKRFRTAYGVTVGSAELAVRRAYAASVAQALRTAKRGKPVTYRVGRAAFVVRGRVVAITLGA